MFTGLIETVGIIKTVRRGNKSLKISIFVDKHDFTPSVGNSIAVNGLCLTVESVVGKELFFTAVYESLARSTLIDIKIGDQVNLERALKLGDRLEGHLVLGHVDGKGQILSDRHQGDSMYRTISVPQEIRCYMAPKGSVALDGISLTIAEVKNETVTVSLIPHTLSQTTINRKKTGDYINIECDSIARYVSRLVQTYNVTKNMQNDTVSESTKNDSLRRLLEKNEW